MKHAFFKSPHRFTSRIALWTSLLHCSSLVVFSPQATALSIVAAALPAGIENEYDLKHTVNFNGVAATEVLRFVSKITGANFIFAEEDLQFAVSVVSEEPVSAQNILSTLIQVLRIHGLKVLEQDGNFLITKAAETVSQISNLVTDPSGDTYSPLITRVFTIKNMHPATLAGIIRPMTSASSLVEVLAQTNQLLISDITTNVDKIATLLQTLDSPNSSLEIESFSAKSTPIAEIIEMTKALIAPFAQGNTVLFVPQVNTNTIFIVSTPHLIEQSLSIMEDIDIPPTQQIVGATTPENLEVHIYKIVNQTSENLMSTLQSIAATKEASSLSPSLLTAIQGMRYISSTGSLVFICSADDWSKLQTILSDADAPLYFGPDGKTSFWIYKVQNASSDQIESALKQIAADIDDPNMRTVIGNADWLPGVNSFVFNGPESTLQNLQTIVPSLDVDLSQPKPQIFVYQLQKISEPELSSFLEQTADSTQDKDLIATVESMKWIASSNSVIFQGTPDSITKLKSLIPSLDVDSSLLKPQIFVYQLKKISEPELSSSLEQIADSSQDKNLIAAVESIKWVASSNSVIFQGTPDSVAKLKDLIPSLDVDASQPKPQIFIYQLKKISESELASSLEQLAESTADKNFTATVENMKWVASSNSVIFQGTPDSVAKLKDLIPSLDVDASQPKPQIFIYQLKKISESELASSLEQLADSTADKNFTATVESMKWVASSNSVIFQGTPDSIAKLQSLMPSLDTLQQEEGKSQVYMYKITTAPEAQITAALNQMAKTIQDEALISAINSMSWLQTSNTLLFTGSQEAITKLQGILPSLDSLTPQAATANTQFLIYTPKNRSIEELEEAMEEFADKLKSSGLQNNPLLSTLDSMKTTDSSKALLFTGDPDSLSQVQTMLQNLDTPSAPTAQTFIYKPVYASSNQLQSSLKTFAQNLDPANPSDAALAQAIYSAEWSNDTNAFTFKADPSVLGRIKATLASLDSPQGVSATAPGGFYLYTLQYVQGDIILKNISNLASDLPSDDPSSQAIIKAIQTAKWIKDNNSLLITGSPYVIDQVKSLIAEFDTTAAQVIIPAKSDFFIYKPTNVSAEEIQDTLLELIDSLESSGLSDPSLLQTLKTAHVVSSTGSILFTGTPDSLTKLKALIPTIDKPPEQSADSVVQTLGETNFLIYKIKQAPSDQLMQALQNFASQLNQSNIADQELAKSLQAVKWIKDTNSLLFTGPTETLQKVEPLASKFDLGTIVPPAQPREAPATFAVYNPKAQSGTELIAILCEFMQNLVRSGVSDSKLFDAISHLRFIEKTNSLIISGDADSISRIEALLTQFDIASSTEDDASKTTQDSANFLIHKLQYHPGAEIQIALQKVSSSIAQSAEDHNTALVDAINSLHWIEITNSLLGTGDPETLLKVKGLIESLDVPLRQVFIEVLVVETSLFNSQNFGLQWGSQFQYLNKTIGALGNFPTTVTSGSGGTNTPPGTLNLSNPLSFTTGGNTPVQGNPNLSNTAVPFSTGFDLGVIGDMLFHKGQSFISLGSLLNALQVDNDTTVVMNPKLITQDGHTSSIFVGQNIPFVGSFVSNSSSSTVQSSNIEYRDVGFNLTITPTLGTSNVITLDINQDISEQSSNSTQVQGSQVTGIQTSHTTMNTRVHVPDKHFLVLSGMIQDTKTHFRSSIPCLGGLPVIGALFAENDRANTKSNIIIFLRPFIVDSYADYDRLTADEEDLYKQQAALQDLKEEFDAGTEMLKNLHNE